MSELVKHQAPDVMTLGAVFTKSGYFQDAREAAQAVVKILAGQELGFGPVASMTGIYIVKGRVSLGANLIAAAVKKGGKYNYRVAELSESACKIIFFEGKEQIGESSFSMEDAKAAGLVNENYRKFSRNMLFARAMSNGAKWFCADVFGGPVYTPDELGAAIDMETGEMLERPKDEVIASAPSPLDIIKTQTDGLFPEESVPSRATLLGQISACHDMTRAKMADRKSAWARYVGDYTEDNAPVEKLQALLADLRSVVAERK